MGRVYKTFEGEFENGSIYKGHVKNGKFSDLDGNSWEGVIK